MPLKPGSDDKIVAENISEMVRSGHSQDQSVAAALHNAEESKEKSGKECCGVGEMKKGCSR